MNEAPVIKTLRFVTVRNRRYVALVDVADVLRDVAGTEETDVRNRLNMLADSMMAMQEKR